MLRYSKKLCLFSIFLFLVNSVAVDAQDDNEGILSAGTFATDFLGFEMVYVPSGAVQMGIDKELFTNLVLNGIFDDYATLDMIHTFEGEGIFETYEANLPSFWIDKYEVSVSQYETVWLRCEETNTCTDSDLPIEVNWFEAIDFCANRDARLPTEEEWEYVASGSQNFIYPWGNELDVDFLIIDTDVPSAPYPVGSEPQNVSWAGAYDMSGNVREWTEDLYQPYYSWSETEFTNWYDFNHEHSRVVRGGSHELGIMQKTTFIRTGMYYRGSAGFRCVRMTSPLES